MTTQTTSLQLDNYPVGNHEGAGVPWQSGATTVALVPTMDSVTALDATKQGYYGLEASSDGGNSFFPVDGYVWMGGTDPKTQGPQYPALSPHQYTGTPPTHVRAVFAPQGKEVSIGIAIQFS
jgi:hypothetical protein